LFYSLILIKAPGILSGRKHLKLRRNLYLLIISQFNSIVRSSELIKKITRIIIYNYTIIIYFFSNIFQTGTVNVIKTKQGIKFVYLDITGVFTEFRRREYLYKLIKDRIRFKSFKNKLNYIPRSPNDAY